jgi:hypothetical protein
MKVIGFEPMKHTAADLQSAPFDHSGTLSYAEYSAPYRIRTDVWQILSLLRDHFANRANKNIYTSSYYPKLHIA